VLWTSGLDVPADKKAVPGFDAPKTNAGFVIRSRYSGLLEPAKAGMGLGPADGRAWRLNAPS
jgi:hypothetical protein